MKIIGYNAKKQTAEIIWNDKLYTLSEEAAILSGIDLHGEISEEALPALITASEEILCRQYLYNQIAQYSKSKKNYLKKLREKGFSREAALKATDHAEQLGYIDDRAYAARYVAVNSAKKGRYRLKNELLSKGISADIADEALRDLPPQREELITIARKLSPAPPQSYADRAKLSRKLASRGFTFEEIDSAINELYGDLTF